MLNKSIKIKVLALLILFMHSKSWTQGVIIKDNNILTSEPAVAKIDPARYHKLQIIDLKIGHLYSDDRAFQKMLKNYGFKPGVGDFIDIGLNYNYLIKKLNFGFKGDLAFQRQHEKKSLWHAYWQGSIGYALFRKQNKIISFNTNFGVETSSIRFGNVPPDFLYQLNYSHESSKLFQKQIIIGPSISFNKLGNKMRMDNGLSFGFEMGVNFAPFTPTWKYGYDDENYVFIGETIAEVPQASKNSIYTKLKIGFWSAK